MDPLTLILFTLFVLAGGGAGGAAALKAHRASVRRQMRTAVLTRRHLRGQSISVFDVFWDLGVNDYALEILGHQGLLLESPQDIDKAMKQLDERIGEHGSYAGFIDETLCTIQEFYSEHQRAGNRRQLPTLKMQAQKLLPMPESEVSAQPSQELVVQPQNQVDYRRLGSLAHNSLDERRRLREDRMPLPTGLLSTLPQPPTAVDIDAVTRLDVAGVLQTIFTGTTSVTDEVQRWWRARRLRALKAELDTRLSAIYEFYASLARGNPAFYYNFYDAQRRWNDEAARIAALGREQPWLNKPWQLCAQVLVEEAQSLATQLAWQAGANAAQSIERIHDYARVGDTAMAGYLVYLNHHAFFAGRAPQYADYVREIEYATHRVQEEIRKLRASGTM